MKTFRAVLLLFLAAPLLAFAQVYPSKPIRLVVPYPPGGGLDLFARPLAHKVTELLGQQAPDGYALLLAAASQYLQPFVSKNVPFDNAKDFTPIISAVNYHNMKANLVKLADVEGLGCEVTGGTPEQFQKQIERTVDTYRKIVNTAGIKPE